MHRSHDMKHRSAGGGAEDVGISVRPLYVAIVVYISRREHMRDGQRILGGSCTSATLAIVSIHARLGMGHFGLFH